MKKLIFVNLKMYLNTIKDIQNYIDNLKKEKDKIVIFPQTIYINEFIKNNFHTGTQNISAYEKGAHTGEISALSVKDIGAEYVLIGHSELREYENNKTINQKIKSALDNNLKVVLCIGENLESYNQNKTKEIIKNQIEKALEKINQEIIISYEPVWAIGTGLTPKEEEIKDIIDYIKNLFNYQIKVLYGGSVSEKNINKLKQIKNIDGFLIGSAAVNPNNLKKIIEVTQK